MSEGQHDPPASLRAAMAGDADATSHLWREHRRWVAAILLAHSAPGADVEDLLQDVAVRFVECLHQVRDADNLRPWLRAVAINIARSAARRHGRRRGAVLALPDDVDDWPPVEGVRQRQESAAQEERLQSVLQVLAGMHADYREPMWLRAVQGLSQQQIADTLGLPVTTIETRLARGRRMLRAAFAEPGRPRPCQTHPTEIPPKP